MNDGEEVQLHEGFFNGSTSGIRVSWVPREIFYTNTLPDIQVIITKLLIFSRFCSLNL